MIDEVHMLTNTAFNAMLKTLEEPPEYLKFVLATTDPQKVPATVLSRCLQFNLRPMAPETVMEHLTQVLAVENVPAEPQALRLLARAARGSMRDALSLTDQAIAFGSGELLEASVRLMLGSVDRSYVFRLLDALARSDGKTVVETSEVLRLHGLSAASTLEEMTTVLQRMAVLQAVPSMLAAAVSDAGHDADPESVETARLAQLLPADETQLLYSLCLHGRGELGLAPDEYAALTMVLLRLLAFKPPGSTAVPAPAAKPQVMSAALSAKKPGPDPASLATPTPVAGSVAALKFKEIKALTDEVQEPIAIGLIANISSDPGDLPISSLPMAALVPSGANLMAAVLPPPWMDMPPHAEEEAAPLAKPLPHELTSVEVEADADARSIEPGLPLAPMSADNVDPATGHGHDNAHPSADAAQSELGTIWSELVSQLIAAELVAAMVRELALQSELRAQHGDAWVLRVERQSLNQPVSCQKLQLALQSLRPLKTPVTLTVEVGPVTDTPARRNAAALLERQRRAEETVENDPLVLHLLQNWGARLMPGGIKPILKATAKPQTVAARDSRPQAGNESFSAGAI